MSTGVTLQIDSANSEATEELGQKLGKLLRGGEIIELRSDLGGGKTTFVRGIAAGMGSNDVVASPSFTISRVYTAARLELHHYDFYRLAEPGLMAQELQEVIADPKNVVAVEWADIVEDVLPRQYIEIYISVTGDTKRAFSIKIPLTNAYLQEAFA
jgi:tRNA threonylcarbamoyladenosine biosynthesis protein TsaE